MSALLQVAAVRQSTAQARRNLTLLSTAADGSLALPFIYDDWPDMHESDSVRARYGLALAT